MKPSELLDEVSRHNVVLSVVNGRLRAEPAGRLPNDLKEAIRSQSALLKAALFELSETARVARVDAERNQRDRISGRGYDYAGPDKRGRFEALPWPTDPAGSLLDTCANHRVELHFDPLTHELIVGENCWDTLAQAIAAHATEIVALLRRDPGSAWLAALESGSGSGSGKLFRRCRGGG